MPATITAIINQKGGTGKTCTCASLGIGLAREGKNVLLVDFDPQSSLTISLGYGRLRKAYLEMHRPILFNELVLSDKLFEHCAEIDEAARNRMELIVRSLAEQNGVTEHLKAENQMEWVRQMNACKAQAEEVVKAELIYD